MHRAYASRDVYLCPGSTNQPCLVKGVVLGGVSWRTDEREPNLASVRVPAQHQIHLLEERPCLLRVVRVMGEQDRKIRYVPGV